MALQTYPMNEIPHIQTTRSELEQGIATAHILASEAYAISNLSHPEYQKNAGDQRDTKGGEQFETQAAQALKKNNDEVQFKQGFRLLHTEGEFLRHVGQTWRHVLTGNSTKLELLEFGIEAAAAAAMIRFGVKQLWPMKSLSKASFASAGDETILSQTLTAAQARNHPVMRMHVRTTETPTIVPR